MAFSIFQCSHCKTILTDSNCISDDSYSPDYYKFSSFKHIYLDSNYTISDNAKDKGCCRKCVYCDSCKTNLGYYYVSTPPSFDTLRNAYLIKKEYIMEYKVHEEECDVHFDINDTKKQQYYMLGNDAERAADFLSKYRSVEQQLLVLYKRINALNT